MTWIAQAAPWLILLAAWPLFIALSLLLGTLNLRRLRVRSAALAPMERSAMHPDARTVLDAMRPGLEALGFTWRASLRADMALAMEPAQSAEADLYVHTSGQAWALTQPADVGHGLGSVEWLTCFDNGENWLGLDGPFHDTLAAPPGWTYFHGMQVGVAAAWAEHAQRLAACPKATTVTDLDEVLRRLRLLRQEAIALAAAQGKLLPAEAGQYRLPWREALRKARQAQRWLEHLGRAANTTHAAAVPAQARQASETLGFVQQEALRAALHRAHNRRHTFWVTAALFLAVGAALFSWTVAWMLLLVIALHEGGHWLAMRWAGYQRQSVFFIPGLGGMATGEKADATPLQKVAVYLAGPMPGLLLALGALIAIAWNVAPLPPLWALQLLFTCLLINTLNLLPITPLDGGRVVETLLFARLPALRLVFALAGVGALAAMAWAWRDPVTVALAGLLALGLPGHWRLARLERAVHRTYPGAAPLDAPAATRRLFGVLQQPPFARWPYAQRVAAVRALLPAQQSRAPSRAEGAGGLLIYLACLALPVAVLFATHDRMPLMQQVLSALWNVTQSDDYDPAKTMQRIDADLAQALQQPDADPVAVTLEAAAEMGALDEHPPAMERTHALYQSAWALAQHRPPHDVQRAAALLGLADTTDAPTQAVQWRQQLLADLQGAQGPARLLLAQVQGALVHQPPPGQTPAQRLALAQQAMENRRAESAPDDYALQTSRELLARLLDDSGQADAAQAQLQANIAALKTSQAPQATMLRTEAENLYAWFLIDHGQAQAAMALAQATAAYAATAPDDQSHWLIDRSLRTWLWAAIEASDATQVRQALERQHAHWSKQEAKRPNLHDARDHLAAAHLLSDDALHQQAMATLTAQPCPPIHVLRPRTALHNDWQNRARIRQQAALKAAGICPSEPQK